MPDSQRDKYENLILLCGNHHTIVDRQANTYTVDNLRSWKDEHEDWIVQKTAPDDYNPITWQVIVQEDSPQVNEADALDALKPDKPGNIHKIANQLSDEKDWKSAGESQRKTLETILASTPSKDRRFAIFSLTRISLAMHLGFVLSDKCRTVAFQFDRSRGVWSWPINQNWNPDFNEITYRELYPESSGPVVLRVSLSAAVEERLVLETVPSAIADIHLSVATPSVTWLQSREQLEQLTVKYRELFSTIHSKYGGRCKSIHVLYAGPTGGALQLGRSINPKMQPAVHTYQYNRNSSPQYIPALILE